MVDNTTPPDSDKCGENKRVKGSKLMRAVVLPSMVRVPFFVWGTFNQSGVRGPHLLTRF